MTKKDENDETGNKDDNPEETGEKGAERVIRVIHELITGKDDKPADNPPDNPPADNPPDKPADKDGEGEGEGKDEEELDDAEKKAQEAIDKAEKERKGLLTKIGGLEKRLKTYQKKEETEMVEEITGVIADLKQSAEDKKTYAEDLKKAQDELKTVRGELTERTTQLGSIAMKAFEEEKKILVDAVRKDFTEKIGKEEADKKAKEVEEKITTPEQLEEVKGWIKVFMEAMKEGKDEDEENDDEGEGTIYSGKGQDLSRTGGIAKLPSKEKIGEYKEARDVINALYDAYEQELYNKQFSKENYNAIRFLEAQKKLNKLWQSVMAGIKKRGGKVIPTGTFDVRMCPYPDCGKVFFGDKAVCPYCGREIKKWERGISDVGKRRGGMGR